MGGGLDEQAHAHDVAEREPPLQPPVRHDPDHAADRDRRRQESEADVAHAESLAGVEHEDRPGGAERDVEREDRQRQGPHRRIPEEPADPFPHLGAQARPLAQLVRRARHDARHEDRPEHEADGVRRERDGRAGSEQERADRRRNELVGQQEGTLHPGIADAEVLARDHPRQERAAGGVGERLGRAEDEQRDEDDADGDRTADDRDDEDDQRGGPPEIGHDDHPPTIEAICRCAAEDTEQQDREVLAQHRQRHEEWILGERSHEQRAGSQHHAVADVVDDGRRQEPAEAPTEPPGREGLDRPGEQGAHRRQDSNPGPGRWRTAGRGSRPSRAAGRPRGRCPTGRRR